MLERGLLTKTQLGQIASSGSLESALGALRDTVYGPFVARHRAQDVELALQDALAWEYRQLASMAPEPEVVVVFRARHDFHNLKVHAKSRRLGISAVEEAFSPMGNVQCHELERLCSSVDDGGERPEGFVETALAEAYCGTKSAVEGFETETARALGLDAWVDRSYFAWYRRSLKRLGYEILDRFVSSEIDVTNLRIFFRGVRQGIPCTIMERLFLEGGTVSPDLLKNGFPQDLKALFSGFKGTPFEGLARQGAESAESGLSFGAWEKKCDDELMNYIKRAKTVPMGPEPAFGYLYGKETEVRNLRSILSGKELLLPPEAMLGRLREPYV